MKKRILIFVESFFPGYKTGPSQSILAIVDALCDRYDFKIICLDRDLGDKQQYSSRDTNIWYSHKKYSILYLEGNGSYFRSITSIIKNEAPDAIYLNGIFSRFSSIFPLISLKRLKYKGKIIMAPRGMLGKERLKLKPLKKYLFLRFTKLLSVYKSVYWHTSSDKEKAEVEEIFGNITAFVAPNMIVKHSLPLNLVNKEEGNCDFFFLGRISPEKNLLLAIELLQKTGMNCNYHIIGAVHNSTYWDQCKRQMQRKIGNCTFHYHGTISNDVIIDKIKEYHFLLLPSIHENFCHAIAESFIAGCPAIIGDKTYWKNLEEKKTGWDIPLNDQDVFLDKIRYCINLDQAGYDDMRISTQHFAKEFQHINRKPFYIKLFDS